MTMNLKKFLFRYAPNFIYFRKANYVRQQWFCYKWIKKHLIWKDEFQDYQDVFNETVPLNSTVFLYWKQGWENAPELVKKCRESIKLHCRDCKIIFLDENNLEQYLRFPEFIEKKHRNGMINEALFSDLLRTCLLIKYGGFWCDATCFMTSSFPQWLIRESFFMFSRTLLPEYLSPIEGSNWFLKGVQNNQLLICIRNFLFAYWKRYDFPINYYIYHLTLAALVNCDEQCRDIWDKKPYLCNMAPHGLMYSFSKKYSEDVFDVLASQSFIHKLTYKYDKKLTQSTEENILQHILNL